MSCIRNDPFSSGARQHVVERALPAIEVVATADQDIGIHIEPRHSPYGPDFLVMGASAGPEGLRLYYHQVKIRIAPLITSCTRLEENDQLGVDLDHDRLHDLIQFSANNGIRGDSS